MKPGMYSRCRPTSGVIEYYETEIARRFNLMVQGIGARNGQPEPDLCHPDLQGRHPLPGRPGRYLYPAGGVAEMTFDPAVDNPFAYENVQCVSFDDDGVATPVDLDSTPMAATPTTSVACARCRV